PGMPHLSRNVPRTQAPSWDSLPWTNTTSCVYGSEADTPIGKKLGIGFGSLLILLAITGWTGHRGITTVTQSLFTVGDQEAPLVDMAMEMKVAMMLARNAMEEYKGATTVMATDNEASLEGIQKAYEQSLKDFDTFAEAILEGKTLEDGTQIIKTDNKELADLVQQSDQIHNERFQVAASAMMGAGRELLEKKAQAGSAMVGMESVFDEVMDDSSKLEAMISDEIQTRAKEGNIGKEAQAILREEVPLGDMANEIKIALGETRIALEELSQARTLSDCDEIEKTYQEKVAAFDERVQAILQGGEIDGTQVVATDNEAIRKAVEELDQNHEDFQKQAAASFTAQRAMIATTQKADETMSELDAYGDQADLLLDKVETLAGDEMTVAKSEGASASRSALATMIVVIGIALLVGIVLGVTITRGITGPLSKAVALAQSVADGDLSQKMDIKRKDEIGVLADVLNNMVGKLREVAETLSKVAEGDLTQSVNQTGDLADAVNQMAAQLNEVMMGIQSSAEQVASSSEELSSSAQNLSSASTEQASSLEETSAAIEELASSIEQNAENSKNANEIARKAAQDAEQGGNAVTETVEAMRKIAEQISIVDDIADQTNLLALNAAIEAARAGEMGKGFAVVAVEVRKLAERSQQAAKEISGLAGSSVDRAEKAGQLIQQVVPDIQKTSELVEEITLASREQSSGANQIRETVSTLDQVTQQNSATSEETAAASEELSGQAQTMQEMVSRFKIGTNGKTALRMETSTGHRYREVAHPTSSVPRLPSPKDKRKSKEHEEDLALEFSEYK
ncbi:MAG: methyl-accepting chemotaxis protein, partial [bacterium]